MLDQIKCIEHVQITVHELDSSLPFYQMLGFIQRRSIRSESEGYTVLVLEAGSAVIELLQFDKPEPRTEPPPTITAVLRPLGYRHVAFRIQSVDAWCNWAISHCLPFFGRRPTVSGVEQVFLRDPDGNLIEFTEKQIAV